MNTQHASTTRHPLRQAIRHLLLPVGALGMPALALAGGPTGEVIVGGDVEVNRPNTNTTVIDQASWRAIIDWQTFNIGLNEYVIFNQPGANAVILNRVVGGDPTSILGSMTANGQVFLVNPYGVFFGASAQLDVHGLLATTLDISNENFMAGNYSFAKTGGAPDAGVVNEGRINADGGYVVLAADHVSNSGVIAARAGHVVMAAGSALTLDIEGDGLVNFAVDEAALSELAGVSNAGTILADGGTVLMTAKVANDLVATAVNNEGLIQAHSISEQDGVIYLAAEGGDIVNAGTLDANGVSGEDGGGIILHGDANIDLQDGSLLTAAGSGSASGGVIRVIAEDTLTFRDNATIRATGGDGNGGFVEVSGHQDLELRGLLDIGQGGQLLIDPTSMSISAGNAGTGTSVSQVGVQFIEQQLNVGVDVAIVATNVIRVSSGNPATSITATSGTGDLFMGIGSISLGSGTGSACALNGGLCIGTDPELLFTPGAGGNISLSGFDINILGGFAIGGDIASAPIVSLGDVSAANISILSTSLNIGRLTATSNVTITGDGGAFMQFDDGVGGSIAMTAGGNINISGAGTLRLGHGTFGDGTVGWFGQTANAGGNITISAGNVYGGAITATTGAITVTANSGHIYLGSAPSQSGGGPVTAYADVNAGGSVQMFANNFGSAEIQVGNVTGTNVNIHAINSDSYGGDVVIRAGNITATTGLVDLQARFNGGGPTDFDSAQALIDAGNLAAATTIRVDASADASASTGGHIVTGALSADEIYIHHNGNKADISLGAITAINSISRALVDVVTGDGFGVTQAGNITVNGDITVAGLADSNCSTLGGCMGAFNQPIAAHVQLRAGSSSASILAGNITVTGNVSITATPASVTVTRSGDGSATMVTGTAGLAELFMSGAAANIGGSLMVQGADALVQVQADTVGFGTVQITGTGHNITLTDDPNTSTASASLSSTNNAGNAMLRILGRGSGSGEAAAASVTLGNVTINGIGEAGLHIAALNTTLGSVAVSAAAATYNRTIIGNYTGSSDFNNAAFNNNGGGDGLNLNQGVVTIGAGTISVYGGTTCGSSFCTENPAQSLTVNGGLSATGVGQAQIDAFATNINITGNITAIATAGNVVNGVGSGFYSGTGASTTGIYNVATTASGSFGGADIELETDAGSGASITVGGTATVSGPSAGFTAESKGTATLGAITVTNTGYNYHETNLHVLSSGPSGALPSFTTSFQGMQVDAGALARITGTTVNVNGAVTMTGVGVSGVLIEGTSVAVQGVSVTTTAVTSTTTLDTRVSPTANTIQRGDALFGITNMNSAGAPVAGATITGNVTVDGVQNANVGINGAVSGVLTVRAGTGDIDTIMPAYFADSGSPPSLPPMNASASAMLFEAGGNILLSGSTLTIGNGNSGVAADFAVTTAFGNGTLPLNGAFIAGGTLDLGNLNLTGNYLWLQANIFGAIGTVTLPTTALVQFTTFDPTRSLGLDAGTGGTAQTLLTESYVSLFSAADTLAFGDSARTGGLLLGETGAVNLGSNDLIFATNGNVTGTNTVSGAEIFFLTGSLSDITANLNTGIVGVTNGNDLSLNLSGPAIFNFGTNTYGNVSLITTGNLTLQGGLSAADILLQANTGSIDLGATGTIATNAITLDADTTVNGTGAMLTATTLNLIGAATTDFVLTTNVDTLNVISGNNISLNNMVSSFDNLAASFASGTYGNVSLITSGGLSLTSGLSASDILLQANLGAINLSANTLTATNAITLDADTTFTGTGLLTAGTLNLIGAATTDFNLLTNIATFNVQSGNDVTIDNSAFSGATSVLFGSGSFGIVDLTTGGNLTLQSVLTAADITLRGVTGLDLGSNMLAAANDILLDTGGTFTGTGLLTANALSLAGGATTDFNLLTDVAAFNVLTGNNITLNNIAHTGATTIGFGAGPFGAFTGNFGGDATLVTAFTGAGFDLTTPGIFTYGANAINAGSGTITFNLGGIATGTGLLTASNFVLFGETNTDYAFNTKAGWISIQSAAGITVDNTAHTGSAYVFFGSDTFTDVAFTMGGDTNIGVASSLTAENATIVVNNGSLDIANHTFNIANDLGLSADNNIFLSGATITAGNLLMVAGSDITDSSGGQGGVKQGGQGAAALTPVSITADAMTLLAGGDILLSQTTFTIGSGDMSALTGITGDSALLAQLSEEGIAPASSAPNATLIANGSVQLGAISVAGGYLYLEARDLALGGAISGPSDLLVQLVPFGGIGTITLESTASNTGTLNLGATDVGLIQDGATLALGTSDYQGNVTLGQAGAVDVGARNFVVATTGSVDSLANITSTGLVASLEELISGSDVFAEPTLEEIDADYSDSPASDDDEEGEEEGEDTDDDGVADTEGGDALIEHDSSGETKVCAG